MTYLIEKFRREKKQASTVVSSNEQLKNKPNVAQKNGLKLL